MTKYIKIILLVYGISTNAQNNIMSYNIRYNNPNDKENWWEYRKTNIIKMIHYYQPSIIGIQEGLYKQITYLNKMLVNYKYVGVAREDGKQKGEYAAIFYDAAKFELIHTQTYWLSETPHTISKGWDAALERIATYGVFKNKTTNDTLHIFNCHYDHIGKIARKKSSELIISLIEKKRLQKKKIIVIGDFNSEPNQENLLKF